MNFEQIWKERDRKVKLLKTAYGIDERVAHFMVSHGLTTKGELASWLAAGRNPLESRGVGEITNKRIYEFAGSNVPEKFKHTCPHCGKGFN